MQKLTAVPNEDFNRPKGIQRARQLPDPKLGALWESIILEERLKAQLLSQAMLNFTMRGKVDRSVIPLHGVIMLVGPPGTGKTSLARGLAHRTAETFPGGGFRLLEVEPHALTSSAMGKTQRAVSELFSQSIAEAAAATSFEAALEIGYRAFGASACAAAAREGIASFLERRAPDFSKTG